MQVTGSGSVTIQYNASWGTEHNIQTFNCPEQGIKLLGLLLTGSTGQRSASRNGLAWPRVGFGFVFFKCNIQIVTYIGQQGIQGGLVAAIGWAIWFDNLMISLFRQLCDTLCPVVRSRSLPMSAGQLLLGWPIAIHACGQPRIACGQPLWLMQFSL